MQGKKDVVIGKLQLSLHLMVDKGKLLGSYSNNNNNNRGVASDLISSNNPVEITSVKPKVYFYHY